MNLALLSNQETQDGANTIKFIVESLNFQEASAAFIASQPDTERYYFSQVQEVYKSFGVDLNTYIDFESEFNEALMNVVLNKPIVHLSGGNTFRFLHSLRSRGLSDMLIEYAHAGGVFIGVSAGAMLLTPTIESAILCGDANLVGLSDFTSLGLVNFMFSPHATKQEAQLEVAKVLVDLKNIEMYLCNDDESIVILNNQVQIFGNPILLKPVNHSSS
jgi:dipeptidase E